MQPGRHLIFSLVIASALGFAALWLATASPTIEAPPGRTGTENLELTCIQAPWDVVVNHGVGQQVGGERPIDYGKTEVACDEAGRRQFSWAIGLGLAAVAVGVVAPWFTAVRLRSRGPERE